MLNVIERLASGGVLALDVAGIVRHWGDGLVQMLGYPPSAMVGRALGDLVPQHRDALAELLESERSGCDRSGARIRVPRCDGSLADLDVSAQPWPEPDGSAPCIIVLVRDITEQSRSQALHRRLTEVTSAVSGFAPLDSILRMVRDAVIEFGGFDRAGVFQVFGDQVRGAWGTDADGKPRSEAGLAETLDDWGPSIPDLAAGVRRFVIETWEPDASEVGGRGPIRHVVIAMRAGLELVGLISADNLLTGRPVTEADVLPLIPFAEEAAVAIRSIRLHERVRTYADDLEREVARRTGELEKVVEDLEQFTYRVAHDLRAPLRAIDGMAHLLAEDIVSQSLDADQILSRLERVSTRAMYAGRLVDDLLTLARVGRRPFAPRRMDLARPVLEAWESLADRRADRSIEFVLGALPPLLADRGMLLELLTRVLDNAIKFTRKAQQARIEVGAESDNAGGETVLYVRDNGVGLRPEDTERVFGAFAQLNSPDEYEGSGIGLAIVKRIMDRHSGRVWMSGAPGTGATLHCAFPSERD